MEKCLEGSCSGEAQESPWTPMGSTINSSLMMLPTVVGSWALWKHKRRKLLTFQLLAVVFMTAWRRLICARCRYYGKPCSTWLGVVTSKMMDRDESKELDRNAMIADFAYIGLLVLYPLPQVLKSFRLTVLYLLSTLLGFGNILTRACDRCGNEFCPMKDLYRRIFTAER